MLLLKHFINQKIVLENQIFRNDKKDVFIWYRNIHTFFRILIKFIQLILIELTSLLLQHNIHLQWLKSKKVIQKQLVIIERRKKDFINSILCYPFHDNWCSRGHYPGYKL